MPATDTTPARAPVPIRRMIADAINAAIAAGHTVTTAAELGAVCVSTLAPRWEVDPRARALSPLGCLLLAHQPPVPRADKALTHLLEVGPGWVDGFELGCAGVRDTTQTKRLDQRLFADGFKLGVEFRALLQRRQGVPVAHDDVTEPIPALAEAQDEAVRRTAAARLLEALPISVQLELVAENARNVRAETTSSAFVDERRREELDMVAEMLVELVGGLRDQGL